MAIRGDNLAYQHIAHMPLCPEYKAMDELRRNGFRGDFHDIVPTKLIPALLADSRAETLIKAGQYPMLRHYLNSSCNMEDYWLRLPPSRLRIAQASLVSPFGLASVGHP